MGLAKLALVLGAALAVAVPALDSAAGGRSGGGRSGGGHAHSGSTHGHHAHHSRGVFFGGFWYSPYYYPYYYYPGYYYPYYGVPLYDPGPADPYWYYCRAANAYYPYVQSCPGGWERHLPSPPSPLG